MPAQVVKGVKEKDIQVSSSGIERKPILSSEKIHPEITETDREAEVHAESKLNEALGQDARLKDKFTVPEDLKDVLASPQDEASDVLKKGSTIVLPISQESYEAGKEVKDEGVVVDKSIVGTRSIVGLVMYATRTIKRLAHSTVKKVIFRKGEIKNAD